MARLAHQRDHFVPEIRIDDLPQEEADDRSQAADRVSEGTHREAGGLSDDSNYGEGLSDEESVVPKAKGRKFPLTEAAYLFKATRAS